MKCGIHFSPELNVTLITRVSANQTQFTRFELVNVSTRKLHYFSLYFMLECVVFRLVWTALLPYLKTIILTDLVERRIHTTVSLDFLKMSNNECLIRGLSVNVGFLKKTQMLLQLNVNLKH